MRIPSGHIYCDVDFFKGFHLNRYFAISSFATLDNVSYLRNIRASSWNVLVKEHEHVNGAISRNTVK